MKQEQKLEVLRHSAAHLLAHAVTELFQNTQLTIGPATKTGFFYDFLPERNFKDEDLPIIEQRMHEIAQQKLPLTHEQVSKEYARELYKDNPFKLELIDQIPGDTVGIARQGSFYDLCRGGHVESTHDIQHFKLLSISGAYWRADREKQALQRISGTAFLTAKELRMYETRIEEAIKYDHRRLGRELDLFSFQEEGVGFPFFHPRGKRILNTLTSFLRAKLDKANYQEIATPAMLSAELWKQSGHYAHYKDNMYFCEIEKQEYAIKPMNCPGAMLVFKQRPHSYRELPLRLAEFGLVHRYELSGALHGLFRVRAFTQDDAHIFCSKQQLEEEILSNITMTYDVLKKFSFSTIIVYLSTRPKTALGNDELWEHATQALKNSLEKSNTPYTVLEGEGAFYGPKIEFHIEDSMGRTWQCGTIQVDFFQPENFDLHFITSQGIKDRPVMVHRVILGSFERFLGILLEHYKGKLPFWIAPLQVKVLTITEQQTEYAKTILDTLTNWGIHAELDVSGDPISGQIKRAQLQQIPWMIVLGNKEVEHNTITLRYLNGKQEFGLTLEQLKDKIAAEL
ncbi:MAG: threonine--tRNA ligase [Candidatus Dependentiae bacterium]|nr:threonine--tRNA ligase [Candidatus Dependentiae bacterium]